MRIFIFMLGVALAGTSLAAEKPDAQDLMVQKLRAEGKAKGWTFKIGKTPISGMPLWAITGYKRSPDWKSEAPFVVPPKVRDLPSKWDWRDKGAVTEVRDQAYPQYCGSCWAFGTVAAFESAIFIATGKKLHIAEQQLVSCEPSYGTCSGGDFAFGFYTQVGANYNSDFPYQADDVACNDSAPHHEMAKSWGYVGESTREPSTEEMKRAIYTYGPIAATVSASGAWQYYKGGVYNECNSNWTNHIIAIVGWDDADEAWILKNSHGTKWGEQGFMRIKYTDEDGNKCNRIGESAAFVVYKP